MSYRRMISTQTKAIQDLVRVELSHANIESLHVLRGYKTIAASFWSDCSIPDYMTPIGTW